MAPVYAEDQTSRPGTLAGKYTLGDCIGAGGMGRVYRAEQPDLSRTVAIKIMHRTLAEDARLARHFRTEAIAAARFSHPNSVAVIDYGETEDGAPFLVMEYVHGQMLSQIVRDQGPLDIARALGFAIQILDALADAHTLGIVHADVKADNVLVETTRDRGEQTKLVDFGLARIARDRGHETDDFDSGEFIAGTPEYMAPEVIRGAPPSPASDVYAVGAMLYEMLTGSTPFAGGSYVEIMRRQVEDIVVPPSLRCAEPCVPRHVESAILRALSKDPGHRFTTAAEFINALTVIPPPTAPRVRRCVASRSPDADGISTLVLPAADADPHLRRTPRGSSQQFSAELAARRDIGDAILRGARDEVATGYLALAELLRASDHPRAATSELEEALEMLGAASERTEPILMALLPLYLELGDHDAAARTSRALDSRTTLTMSRT